MRYITNNKYLISQKGKTVPKVKHFYFNLQKPQHKKVTVQCGNMLVSGKYQLYRHSKILSNFNTALENETIIYRILENKFRTDLFSFCDLALLNTFQNLRVSSPAPVTMASPSGDIAKYKTR